MQNFYFSLTIFFLQATCNFVQIDEGQKYFHYLLGNIHLIILVTVVRKISKGILQDISSPQKMSTKINPEHGQLLGQFFVDFFFQELTY